MSTDQQNSHLEESVKRAIVFVEADVPDHQSLLAGLEPGTEVHVLDAGEDGLALMAQILAERNDIDALHILSHGSEGAVSLGSLLLTADALAARAEDLATIRAALTPEADILLYGCNVGAGTNGAAFVEALAAATGADVAASTDLTGAAELGGNWELEVGSGDIETTTLANEMTVSGFNSVLAAGYPNGTVTFAGYNSYTKAMSGEYLQAKAFIAGQLVNLMAEMGEAYIDQPYPVNSAFTAYIEISLIAGKTGSFMLKAVSAGDFGDPQNQHNHNFSKIYVEGWANGNPLYSSEPPFNSDGYDPEYTINLGNHVDTLIDSFRVYFDGDSNDIPGIFTLYSFTIADFSDAPPPPAEEPDTTPPTVESVTMPDDGIYLEGQHLDFTLHFSEPVEVTNEYGSFVELRLGHDPVHATYYSGSGTDALTFRYTVEPGKYGATDFSVQGFEHNSSITDLAGNVLTSMSYQVQNLFGSTSGIKFSEPPSVTSIELLDDEVTNATSVQYKVTFSESVTGVDANDFDVSISSGDVSFERIDVSGSGDTYTVTVQGVSGDGKMGLVLKGAGTGIVNGAGQAIEGGYNSGPEYTIELPNVAPVITGFDDSDTRVIADKGGPVLIDLGTPATITDTDSPNFDEGSLKVWIDHHLQADDYLGIRTGNGVELSAGLTVGSIVSVDGQNIGTIGTADRGEIVVNFNAQSTPALVSKLFQNFTFDTLGEVTGGRIIKFTVTDGDGGETTSDFASMVVMNQLTVDITADRLALKSGETATVTFTFSQDTSSFLFEHITVQGGTLSPLEGSGRVYTAKFTPDSNTQDVTASVYIDANKIPGHNVPSAASNTLVLTADTKLPAIESIEREEQADEVTNADSLVYRVTFSEPVTGVDSGGFIVNGPVGAAVSEVASTSSTVYEITVSGGDLADFDGEVTLELSPDANIIDAAGNKVDVEAQPETSEGYLLDNTGPISTDIEYPSAGTYTTGQILDFIVTFDEPVKVIDAPELALTLGNETVYAQYMWGAESDTLTFRYTVQTGDLDVDGIEVTGFHFEDGQLADALGNLAQYTLESAPVVVAVDALSPSVSSVSVPENATYKAGQELMFTVNFDEPITVNTTHGVPTIDLTLDTGGTVQAVYVDGSGSTALNFVYTVQLGDVDTDGVEVADTICLNGGSIQDAAGNNSTLVLNNVGPTSGVLVAAVAPTVTAIERVDGELVTDDSVQYRVKFSEKVAGVDADDFTLVLSGVTAEIASVEGDEEPFSDTYTVTIDNISGEGTLRLDLKQGGTGIVSEYGNAIEGGYTGGQSYSVDTERPMLAEPIRISDTALKIGDTAEVTFVFTEAVAGFTEDDVTVPNGTLSGLASDDGITWTATLTPSDGATSKSNVLTLDLSGIADEAGNAGLGSIDSPSYAGDTLRPFLTSAISISRTDLKAGDTATVTFAFNEAVSGLDIGDVTVPNGTLSDLESVDGGFVWTATLTPDEGARDASNVLTLDYSGITDAAGNLGVGETSSVSYAVDTVLPKLAQPISISDTALKIGDTATVTFVFTEAVTGFTVEDVTVSHGTLTSLSSQDEITWTATLTPDEGASAATNVLSLDLSGIATLSGNLGSGTAESDNYTVDTVAPTTEVSLNLTSLKAGAIAMVTFTFSEEPQDFTLEDVTAQGGALSDLSELLENDDGTWSATAIFTPSQGLQSESNVITVNTSWMNAAGNAPEAPAVSANYVVDTVPPDAPIITSSDLSKNMTPVIAGTAEPGTAVIVTVAGATYTVQATDEGWTLDLGVAEPTSGALSLDVNGENPVLAFARDAVGNESEAGSQTLVIDSTAPTVTVTLDTDRLKAGDTATVLFTFSEQPLNFSLADVTAQGGELSDVSGLVEHDNSTWSVTATFTPSPDFEAATNAISVGVDWADVAGNAPAEPVESDSFAVDTLLPVAPGFTSEALSNDTTPVLAGTAEPGSWVEVTVGGATYTIQADANGWTLDLGTAVPDSGNLSLNLNGENAVSAIARDALGNESEAGTQTIVIDTTPPSVLITMSDTNLTERETATVTFTFDEAPHGFTLDAVTAEGGQLSDLSEIVENGDGTWSATAVFTPTPNLNDRTNVITVGTEWADAAGNAPLEAVVSGNYVISTYPPEPVTPPVTPPVIPPVDQWENLPDNDGDGIPESVENLVPGMIGGVIGDGNGDGIADVLQVDVSSLPWAQSPDDTTRFVTLVNHSGLAQAQVKPLAIAPDGLPADLKLPLGLLSFKVDKVSESGSVDFTVYLDSDIPVNGYWKEINGEWVDIATSITTEGGKTRITFTIEDGGRFDADGVKNGTIVDPGAPGWRTVTHPDEDADGDQFPDALEEANGLTPGVKDNDVFASTKLFVMQLYRDFLYREAEPEGLAYWQARLDSGELTREDVAYTFLFASEFQDNAGAVARLYMGTYDRIPDNEGMHYWVDALQEGQSLTQVAEQFAASDEFAELYGSLDNEGFVSELYLNVQGREAEAEGHAWWISQLEAGMSRGEVLVRFTQSEEFVANSQDEVAVTLNYVGLLDRTPEQAGFDYWLNEIMAGRSETEVIRQFIGTHEYHDRFLPADAADSQIRLAGSDTSMGGEVDNVV